MLEITFLRDVLIFLAAAMVVVSLFRPMRASPVLGYLVAGALIGPYGPRTGAMVLDGVGAG